MTKKEHTALIHTLRKEVYNITGNTLLDMPHILHTLYCFDYPATYTYEHELFILWRRVGYLFAVEHLRMDDPVEKSLLDELYRLFIRLRQLTA